MRQLKISKSITNRESLSLDRYLQEISKEDLITAEEEVRLAREIKKGSEEALNKIVKANLRFVVSVAKQYQHHGLSLPDLINEGNLGLIKAAKRFDQTRGFKFISYAVWWIRQSILQALAEQSRIVRLPMNQVGSINKVNKILAQFEQEFQREPSEQEISKLSDIPIDKISEIINISSKHVSVDAPFADGDGACLLDMIENKNALKADKSLILESLQYEIDRSLKTLTNREADIIRMFFGLDRSYGLSLEEIAENFSLTRERVRQIKERAIRKLQNRSRSQLLRPYL